MGAHPDDVEIMAFPAILNGIKDESPSFGAVVCTKGDRAPLGASAAPGSREALPRLREEEQRQAAAIGKYAVVAQLGESSERVRSGACEFLFGLRSLLGCCRPSVIYTHAPTDRHPTHIAVCAAVLRLLRDLPPHERPQALMGCEVWGSSDWVPERRKVAAVFDDGAGLSSELIGQFRSQLGSGKNYEDAVRGRWSANSVFNRYDRIEERPFLSWMIDMSPLLRDERVTLREFVQKLVQEFGEEVLSRLPS